MGGGGVDAAAADDEARARALASANAVRDATAALERQVNAMEALIMRGATGQERLSENERKRAERGATL